MRIEGLSLTASLSRRYVTQRDALERVETALFGAEGPLFQNLGAFPCSARLYRINLKAADARPLPAYSEDRLAQLKKEYEFAAKEPSNLRYGYVRAG